MKNKIKNNLKNKQIIGIDGRCLLDQNYTGVGEYTIALIKKLLKDYPQNKYIIFLNSFKSRNIQKKLIWLRHYKNVSIKHYHWPSKLLNFSLWFFRYPKLDKLLGGVDIFIAPNISFLAISEKTKFILTVHDLSFERFKETFSWRRRLWHFIVNPRQLAKEADEIWTVSRSTKWDLEQLYNVVGNKIKVYPILQEMKSFQRNNISEKKKFQAKKRYNLPDKFILYLGTIEPRKNILKIVQAFEYLRKNKLIDEKYKLVLAGQLGWRYNGIVENIKSSEFAQDIKLTNFVKRVDKPYFYHLANIFVYPSLFEGFGIPVVEAMTSGTAIITSNNSSLPEIVGRGALMIDPDTVTDLIDALELLSNDQKIREYYIKLGFERARELLDSSAQIKLLK
jgi:glycosyltransferase involved in cell wall biosynthesis